jgi:hypothetical protein
VREHWQNLKRRRRICRYQRKLTLLKHLPRLKELCDAYSIDCRRTEHGFQFLYREYVLNWAPTTNKVTIQYRLSGDGQTARFGKNGQPGRPRIQVALEELIELVKREEERPLCPGQGIPAAV